MSHDLYRDIVEMSGDLVCRYLPDTTLTFVNDAYCRYFGRSREELIGHSFLDLMPEEDRDAVARHVAELIAEPRDERYEHAVTLADGSTAWQEWIDRPVPGTNGTALEIQAVGRDVTERRRMEDALRESEERYRLLAELTSDFVFEVTVRPDGRRSVRWVTEAVTRLTGYSWDELGQMGTMRAFVLEDDLPAYDAHIATLQRGQSHSYEVRIRQKDGSIRWQRIEERVVPHPTRPGWQRWLGAARDITEQKQAEEERARLAARMEQERARLDAILESTPAVVWEGRLEPDGRTFRMDFISDYAERITGYGVEEWLFTPNFWLSIVHPDDLERMERESAEHFARGSGVRQVRWVTKYGRVLWVESHTQVIRDDAGRPVGTRGVTLDITERRRTEDALRESEQRYALATEAGRVTVWDIDPVTGIVRSDAELPSMLGLTAGVQRTVDEWLSIVHPDDRERMSTGLLSALRGEGDIDATGNSPMPTIECRMLAADGSIRWMMARGTVLRRPDGQPYRAIGTVTDLTEIREAESALREGDQRLQTIIDNSSAIIYVKDTDGRYRLVNRAYLELWQVSRQQAIGHTDAELFDPRFANTFSATDRLVWETGRSLELEESLLVNGEVRTYISIKFPLRNEAGRVYGLCGISTDITERARAAEQVRAAGALLQSSIDALSAHVAILDERGRIIAVNQAWRRFSVRDGFSGGQCCGVGKDYLAVCAAAAERDGGARRALVAIRAVLRGDRTESRLVYSCAGPEDVYWFQMRVTRFEDGGSVHLLVAHEDITEVKQAEESLQAIASRLLQLQDDERRRIARELHDVTAQSLFAITMNLARIQQQTALDARSSGLLADSLALGEQSLQEIRTLSYVLHPPLLDQTGLVPALEWYVEGFVERSGIDVNLAAVRDIGRLASEVETALFRVVQESLTNIHRHSGSVTANIRLTRQQDRVILQVRDQGRGIGAEPFSSPSDDARSLGVGIPGMRQRLRQLGGDLRISSSRRGTTVTATVPVAGEGGPP